MKILFISRAYPPIGKALSKIATTRIIANKSGKKNLPFFLFWTALRVIFILPNYEAVLLGDGVLSPLAVFWKILNRKKKYISIVHGLDITFARKKSFLGKTYKSVNIPSLKKLDRLIMVGRETIAEAQKLGIPGEKCEFIPNGFEMNEIISKDTREDLEKLLGMNLSGEKVIFRGGRFTKHKGVEWFIRNVMPKLPENYLLVAAGGGIAKKTAGDENYYPKCEKAVEDLGMENRVKLMLNLERPEIKTLFNTCDLYISPNIKVPGSLEGFGITAIEAAACKRVVLASDLEGLKDAVKNGQNGFLLEPENADAWADKIKEILAGDDFRAEFGEKASKFTFENYSWDKIAKRYLEVIKSS
jgi:glycosyltransferase involved in cell wall biosynthesis